MTVRVDNPLPPVATFLAAIDTGARTAANAARTAGVPIVRAALPARSGRARRGTTGRVQRTPTGYALVVAPTARVRYPSGVSAKQVIRWLHTGTGVFGPLGRRIRPRKADAFVLPGWAAESVRGQRGHDYYGAGKRAAEGVVVRAFERGAYEAARLAERVL